MYKVTSNWKECEELMRDIPEKAIPWIKRKVLFRVATLVKQAEQAEMRQVFSNPTPYTINSCYLATSWKSMPRRPKTTDGREYGNPVSVVHVSRSFLFDGDVDQAAVYFKGTEHGDPHFLQPQVEGGPRTLKKSEMLLGKRFTVPGQGMQLDQYGNVPRGQVTKMMSAAGVFGEQGFTMNKRKATGSRGKNQYFAITTKRGKLLPGIYERIAGKEVAGRIARYNLARGLIKAGKHKGMLPELNARTKAMYPRGIRSAMIFSPSAPQYKKRFDFFGVARKVAAANMLPEFIKASNEELSKLK